jgi:rubrerythrin
MKRAGRRDDGRMVVHATTEPEARATLAEVRELFCAACGYGIVVRREPPACPMCRANDWLERPRPARWN